MLLDGPEEADWSRRHLVLDCCPPLPDQTHEKMHLPVNSPKRRGPSPGLTLKTLLETDCGGALMVRYGGFAGSIAPGALLTLIFGIELDLEWFAFLFPLLLPSSKLGVAESLSTIKVEN